MAQIFPRWTNDTPLYGLVGTVVLGSVVVFGFYVWASPWHTDVGYKPKQPVQYSHELHAGQLGMDCRYCHAYVERSPHAGVPPTQTCMNCHLQVKKDSELLEPVRKSWAEGSSIPWVRIHKSPDFVYFDHSAHVAVGVGENRAAIGCETCHGRVDTMVEVKQQKPLSMSWCLECHTNPAPNLRPADKVTAMGWQGDFAWRDQAMRIASTLHPPGALNATREGPDGKMHTFATAGCSGCHR